MDSYLDIALTVLRAERRPLTPRAIMAVAYRSGIVDHRLHGRTQHKTLGARLSEDLVRRSDHSVFFRPAPGRFFLREFLADTSIPEEFRRPVPTRRRFRELVLGPALAVDGRALASRFVTGDLIKPELILRLLKSNHVRYEDPRRRTAGSVFFRSFVCVQRGPQILTYRLGKYRDDRDAFVKRRCIGFVTLVHEFEHNLFTRSDHGIVSAGIRATKIDLDIPEIPGDAHNDWLRARLSHFIWCSGQGAGDLLAVICFECPPWFEPTKRRLALNDVRWLDEPASVNDVDDFDPWSQKVLAGVAEGLLCQGVLSGRTSQGNSRQDRD